jgi:beta-N-acetylhexosaminidase
VAIDQEGGQLMAVGDPATPFAGNLALAAAGSEDLARRVGVAIGRELAAVGCSVDWAPDLDLASLPESPAVGARAFGDDPVVAGDLGAAFIDGLQYIGVAATAKHFPGSGATAVDPHDTLPVVDVGAATLETRELRPFRAAVAAGARLVMVSHAAFPGLEPGGRADVPAMRSRSVLVDVLRRRLGFEGVVVSDALDMGAVDQAAVAGAALAALDAGVDLLLAGPAQASRRSDMDAIRAGLTARPDRLADAASRVARLREWTRAREVPDLDVVGSAEHLALAAELASRAVTLVRDDPPRLPLRPGAADRVLVIMPRPSNLTPADTSETLVIRLAQAVRRRHPFTNGLEIPIDPGPTDIDGVLAAADGYRLVIVGTIDAFRFAGQQALIRALSRTGHAPVLVPMRMPLDAWACPEAGTVLCTYSIHDPSTEAAAAVLFGECPAPGRLPLSGQTIEGYRGRA